MKIFYLIIITLLSLYICPILFLVCLSEQFHIIISVMISLLIPLSLLMFIFMKDKHKVIKLVLIYSAICILTGSINYGINAYKEYITIDTTPNINVEEYLPFDENSKIVHLENSTLKLNENLPIVDGAAAVFPVYSAFVEALYPIETQLYDECFQYNNTSYGYTLLAEKKIDIFFGAYPSKEQIAYAKENNTEFEYTPIGKEAFVFFVHKDNPVNSLTTEQLKAIYTGEITNWKEVGGKEETIKAFQRNEGSGSQSMLIRFMEGKKLMDPPSEQVNSLMSGIITQVSDYQNKDNSIGFSFRYYVEGIIKNEDIKIIAIDNVKANVENIKNGSYKVTTPLYAVTYKNNPNENVKKMIDWVLSEEGQYIIEETGYVGVKK